MSLYLQVRQSGKKEPVNAVIPIEKLLRKLPKQSCVEVTPEVAQSALVGNYSSAQWGPENYSRNPCVFFNKIYGSSVDGLFLIFLCDESVRCYHFNFNQGLKGPPELTLFDPRFKVGLNSVGYPVFEVDDHVGDEGYPLIQEYFPLAAIAAVQKADPENLGYILEWFIEQLLKEKK